MTRKLKPVETNLEGGVQAAVLALLVQLPDNTLLTVGDLVTQAEKCMRLANEAIAENALIRLTAASLMKQEKKRGEPQILVHIDGSVVLRVSYGDSEGPSSYPSSKQKLPSLASLRKRAKEMKVDISDLGRQKREILARLNLIDRGGRALRLG